MSGVVLVLAGESDRMRRGFAFLLEAMLLCALRATPATGRNLGCGLQLGALGGIGQQPSVKARIWFVPFIFCCHLRRVLPFVAHGFGQCAVSWFRLGGERPRAWRRHPLGGAPCALRCLVDQGAVGFGQHAGSCGSGGGLTLLASTSLLRKCGAWRYILSCWNCAG